jgi:hypothetical protein
MFWSATAGPQPPPAKPTREMAESALPSPGKSTFCHFGVGKLRNPCN